MKGTLGTARNFFSSTPVMIMISSPSNGMPACAAEETTEDLPMPDDPAIRAAWLSTTIPPACRGSAPVQLPDKGNGPAGDGGREIAKIGFLRQPGLNTLAVGGDGAGSMFGEANHRLLRALADHVILGVRGVDGMDPRRRLALASEAKLNLFYDRPARGRDS